MDTNNDVPRMLEHSTACDPLNGTVKWHATKSIWFTVMVITSIIGGYFTFNLENVLVFIVCTTVMEMARRIK